MWSKLKGPKRCWFDSMVIVIMGCCVRVEAWSVPE